MAFGPGTSLHSGSLPEKRWARHSPSEPAQPNDSGIPAVFSSFPAVEYMVFRFSGFRTALEPGAAAEVTGMQVRI